MGPQHVLEEYAKPRRHEFTSGRQTDLRSQKEEDLESINQEPGSILRSHR